VTLIGKEAFFECTATIKVIGKREAPADWGKDWCGNCKVIWDESVGGYDE
jgi:hypothetical protein